MPAPDAAWWPLEFSRERAFCKIGARSFAVYDYRRYSTNAFEVLEIRNARSLGSSTVGLFVRCPDLLSLRAALLAVAHPANLPEDSGNPQE
jgi:hypothetical protein